MHHGQRLHGTPVNIQTNTNENIIFPPLFSNYMLDISSGIESLGELRWQLALCLLLCWIIVFICLSTGVKSLGKVRSPFHLQQDSKGSRIYCRER